MAGNDALTPAGTTPNPSGGQSDEALNAQGYGATLWTPDEQTIANARVSQYLSSANFPASVFSFFPCVFSQYP